MDSFSIYLSQSINDGWVTFHQFECDLFCQTAPGGGGVPHPALHQPQRGLQQEHKQQHKLLGVPICLMCLIISDTYHY